MSECIVNLSRRSRTHGFFVPNLWVSHFPEASEPEEHVYEISLNPDHMMRPSIQWHFTLVHEMVHLWQHENGKPSHLAYHNRQWAVKMLETGLLPTGNGEPDCKMTGQSVSHLIVSGGLFEQVYNSLDPEELESLRLKYLPVASLSASEKTTPMIRIAMMAQIPATDPNHQKPNQNPASGSNTHALAVTASGCAPISISCTSTANLHIQCR